MGIFCSTSLIYKQLKPGSFISWNYSMVHASLIQKRWLQSPYLQCSSTMLNTFSRPTTPFCIFHCLFLAVPPYLSVDLWHIIDRILSNSLWTIRMTFWSYSLLYIVMFKETLREGFRRDRQPSPRLFFIWPFLPGWGGPFKKKWRGGSWWSDVFNEVC